MSIRMASSPALINTILGFSLAALTPNSALAYIGPGAGLGAIAVTIAVGFGFLLLLIGLVWYPLKRLLKRGTGGSKAKDKSE
ncbi:hypothetical protein OEZ60_02030 [Defluviimonas sp. WL0024]|uniref:Uncharacterized protein n=2 Tax=Albidovulum TaxID=205889 RepID=A0ABT3JAX1_9RHOB|nr:MULTISPECIES: hypothetical protein [Defluviimonas]MCU9846774.1 hypothetical protein [Defluviimonas sp. WL0024]MCW3784800.1 hypothetical protein [Defluviimonas salinarum]